MRTRSFRPSLDLVLEERLALSTGGVAASASAVNAPVIPAHQIPFFGPVGAMGDSYTDEYQFYAPDRYAARNWVEILHATRGVAFGPFTAANRGEPRNQGFAYDWARSSATSDDMMANQLPGLTAQVASGKVQYASVFIGGNDYLNLILAAQAGAIPPQNIPAALTQTTTNLIKNVTIATDTLLAANPNAKVVLWTLPSVGLIPIAQIAAATSPVAKMLIDAVGQAEDVFNAAVKQMASANPRVALVDLATVTKSVASSPTLPFDGITVDLTTPGDDYHNFFLGDFYHPGTIGQGIIADTFAQAIDTKFGAQLFPLPPTEIVQFAATTQRHVLQLIHAGKLPPLTPHLPSAG
jgi:hypothetical protein